MISENYSFNLKPATTQQPQLSAEQRQLQAAKGLSAEQRQLQTAKGLSAEQRKALELLEEKCPVAQRDDGYDTVY